MMMVTAQMVKHMKLPQQQHLKNQKGAIMIEVVVALFFVTVVFVGHIGSQAFMQRNSMEASRRAEAQGALNYIIERMQQNRQAARCYAFTAGSAPYVGSGGTLPGACGGFADPETQLIADNDILAWHTLLSEGSVDSASGTAIGGIKRGRGCIEIDESTNPDTYTISVAWESPEPINIPANASKPCAQGTYGNEDRRRVITTTIQFADLK